MAKKHEALRRCLELAEELGIEVRVARRSAHRVFLKDGRVIAVMGSAPHKGRSERATKNVMAALRRAAR